MGIEIEEKEIEIEEKESEIEEKESEIEKLHSVKHRNAAGRKNKLMKLKKQLEDDRDYLDEIGMMLCERFRPQCLGREESAPKEDDTKTEELSRSLTMSLSEVLADMTPDEFDEFLDLKPL